MKVPAKRQPQKTMRLRGFTYLCSPYSHPDPAVRERRYNDACWAAARLMQAGVPIFAPIPHSHPVEQHFEKAQDFDFWMGIDLPILKAARQSIVLTIPGWKESRGVGEEVRRSQQWSKPVAYIGMESLADDFFLENLFAFWDQVDAKAPDKCWEWRGPMGGQGLNGYGRYTAQGRIQRANRVSLEFVDGPLGDKFACHTCDNPKCCSPWHLYAGTAADNMQDMLDRGRHVPPRGEHGGNAKYTDEDVAEMRRLRSEGVPLRELQARYGISISYASMITNGHWRKVAA